MRNLNSRRAGISACLFFLLNSFGFAQVAGEFVSVKGEVIDTYCYSSMGAKGESHRQCGLDCAKAGIPVGLLAEGMDKVYVLLPNKDKASLPQAVIEKMGRTATIKGHAYSSGGSQFLMVESVE